MAGELGSVSLIATVDTSQYDTSVKKINSTNKVLADSSDKASSSSEKSWGKMGVAAGVAAGVVSSAFTKITSVISSSIGSAVKRVDTLNNSSRTFQNLGFSATDSSSAMSKLSDSIKGLPTPLDDAVRGMTSLASTYGDVSMGQKVFTAMNDAVIGFGGSTADVNNAINQLSQLPMDGPLDAQTWNSLRNSGFTPVLNAMAKESGVSMGTLKDQFGTGKLTVADFTNELIKMDTDGGGGMKSLSTIARDATGGIGTGFENAKTAVVRGVADIVGAIGAANISGAISDVGDVFEKALKGVADAISAVIPKIQQMFDYVDKHKDAFKSAAVGIAAMAGAVALFKGTNYILDLASDLSAVVKVARLGAGALDQLNTITKAGAAAQALMNAAMAANLWVLLATVVIGVVSALVYFFTQTKTGQKIWQGFMDFMGEAMGAIAGFFVNAWNTISSVWSAVAGFFTTIFGTIFTVASTVINAIVTTIGGIFNTIVIIMTAIGTFLFPIVQGIFTFIYNVIILIVAIVTNLITIVYNIVSTIVNTVFSVVGGIAGWIWNNVLSPIINFIGGVVNTVIGAVVGAWNTITGVLGAVGGWIWNTIIAPVANFFTGLWNGVINGVKSVWNGITGALGAIGSWINNNVIRPVAGFFTGLWNGITNGIRALASGIANIIGSIVGIAKAPLNAIIDGINGVIGMINSITIPDWVPGLGGKHANFGMVPKLYTGGIVQGSAAGQMIIAGDRNQDEAIVPLDQLDSMVQPSQSSDASNTTVNYNISLQGAFASTPAEQRRIAEVIGQRLGEINRAKGMA